MEGGREGKERKGEREGRKEKQSHTHTGIPLKAHPYLPDLVALFKAVCAAMQKQQARFYPAGVTLLPGKASWRCLDAWWGTQSN